MPEHLPNRLKRLRQEAGITQQDMSGLLGISQAQVSRIETGIRPIAYRTAANWLARCGASLEIRHQETGSTPDLAQLGDHGLELVRELVEVWPDLPAVLRQELADQVRRWRDRYRR